MPPFRPITDRAAGATLRRVAKRHGHVSSRGPKTGDGNPAELVAALGSGELATVLIAPEEQAHLLRWLDEATTDDTLLQDTIKSLALQLRQAWEQED